MGMRKFLIDTRWAMIAKLLSVGLWALVTLILARALHAQAYGLFALTISVLTFARIISGSGLGNSTGKHLANLNADEVSTKAGPLLAAGLLTQMAAVAVLAGAVWLLKSEIAARLGIPQLEATLKIGAVTLVFYVLAEFAKACFQGLRRFDYLALVVGTEFIGKLILAAGLALFGLGLTGALTGFTIALVLATAVSLIIFAREGMRWPAVSGSEWRSLAAYSLPLMLTTAGFVVYTDLDNLMLGFYSGARQVGAYSLAMNIARAPMFMLIPVGQAAAPHLVKLWQADDGGAAEFVRTLLKYTVAIFFPLAAGLFLLAPQILGLIGKEYVGAYPALRVMTVFAMSLGLGAVVTPALDYMGRAWRRAVWLAVAVLANVVLNIILIPRFGGVGAALATACTHTPYMLSNVVILARITGLKAGQIVGSLAAIFVGGLAAVSITFLILTESSSLWLSLIVGAGVYLGAIFLLGVVSREEIGQLLKGAFVDAKEAMVNVEEPAYSDKV